MKYIDAEKLKAEIERLYNGEAPKHDPQCDFDDGYFTGIGAISQFIDTIESEKPIISGDNLESAIDSFWNTASGYQPKFVTLEVKKDGFEKIARYFAEWGAEHLAAFSKTLAIKPGDEVTINGHKIIYDKDKGYVTIVKSEESVPNDLEEAADEYSQKEEYMDVGFCVEPVYIGHKTEKAFITGAKWQKQHDAELIEITYNDGITIGMTKQKEQMMKEAIDGEVDAEYFGYKVIRPDLKQLDTLLESMNHGDKVHIIIVKED